MIRNFFCQQSLMLRVTDLSGGTWEEEVRKHPWAPIKKVIAQVSAMEDFDVVRVAGINIMDAKILNIFFEDLANSNLELDIHVLRKAPGDEKVKRVKTAFEFWKMETKSEKETCGIIWKRIADTYALNTNT